MRTTLIIDDDVYQAAVRDPKLRGQTISHYVIDALRHRYQGLSPRPEMVEVIS